MKLSNRAHELVHGHLHWIQSELSSEDLLRHGGHVAQLATGKATDVAAICSSALSDARWLLEAVRGAKPDDQSDLYELGLLLILHAAGGYDRRIVKPICGPL